MLKFALSTGLSYVYGNSVLKLGLTGGIASGKSTAAETFRAAGAVVLDADLIAHQQYQIDGPAYPDLIAYFGKDILDTEARIDRQRLGARVFGDPAALAALNARVHPHVRKALAEAIQFYQQWEDRHQRSLLVVLMIPLLYESGLEALADKVAVVYCEPEQQLQRLMARNGFSEAEAQARLDAQIPITEKKERADYCIDNRSDPAHTREQIHQLLGVLTWEPYDPSLA